MTFVLIGISAHPVWIGLIFAYFFGFTRTSGSPIYFPIIELRRLLQPTSGAAREARCSGPIT